MLTNYFFVTFPESIDGKHHNEIFCDEITKVSLSLLQKNPKRKRQRREKTQPLLPAVLQKKTKKGRRVKRIRLYTLFEHTYVF